MNIVCFLPTHRTSRINNYTRIFVFIFCQLLQGSEANHSGDSKHPALLQVREFLFPTDVFALSFDPLVVITNTPNESHKDLKITTNNTTNVPITQHGATFMQPQLQWKAMSITQHVCVTLGTQHAMRTCRI